MAKRSPFDEPPAELISLGGGRPSECFEWFASNSQRRFRWNIEAAIRCSMRQKRRFVNLPTMAMMAERNERMMNGEINPRYAMRTDLSRPLIFVHEPGLEHREGNWCILIDGWHRLLKGLLVQQQLTAVILSREQEEAVRVLDIIYL